MEINIQIFDDFRKWADSLDCELGTAPEDWGPWYKCFEAGFAVGVEARSLERGTK